VSDLIAIGIAAASTAALAATGPAVIRRLPEPQQEPQPESQPLPAPESDAGLQPEPPAETKILYVELANRRHLAWWLAAFGAVVGAIVGWRLGLDPVLPAWVLMGGAGVVLGYVDAQTRLLPTRIIAPCYGLLVAALVAAALASDDPRQRLVGAALGWLVFGGFYVVLWLVYPRGLGYGDVRLSGLLGLGLGYLGWGELLTGLYAGFLIGGVGGALLAMARIVDRKRYPFGPFMLIGSLVGLVWGESVADWYTSSW
jgi:leader peptidase (prepilin peptidase)/N-methyltransferase